MLPLPFNWQYLRGTEMAKFKPAATKSGASFRPAMPDTGPENPKSTFSANEDAIDLPISWGHPHPAPYPETPNRA